MMVTFKPNVQELQQDTTELLQQISQLMARAGGVLGSEGSSQRYVYQQKIDQAARNIANLELRMAIVAPMKAGKSTIINSLIGQELLPSRNTAMTTLPTEIVFNAALTEPVLTLSPKVLSLFQAALTVLRWQIKALGVEQMREKIAQYPHLMTLLESIAADVPLFAKACGREEIANTLTTLNDVIRLCNLINPAQDPLAHLVEFPRLETPFWDSPTQALELGNLVIIDTPGPNEAGELKLMSVVEEQLRRSSLVLIVLDFTQLNSQAAAEVKKQVQPVIELLGKENLYILVNKVDQRRRGDLSPQEVQEFVCADLELDRHTDRVFEMSAIQAFAAAKFMRERQQYPEASLPELESASALAQEALGPRWVSKLARSSVAQLQEEALYLWEDSGFRPFLEGAIQALLENTAPRCLMSALSLCRNLLLELKDELNLCHSALKQDEEKLRLEVESLEADLLYLDQCRHRLQSVAQVSTTLEQKLNDTISMLHRELQVRVEDFLEENSDWDNLLQQLSRGLQQSKSPNAETFSEWIRHSDLSFQYRSFGMFEFTAEREAQEFAEQAIAWIQQKASNLLKLVSDEIEKQIEEAKLQFQQLIPQETIALIEKARTRLQKNFELELSFPRLSLPNSRISCQQIVVERTNKHVKNIKIKKRRPFYFLFLIKVERKIPVTKVKTYYTVSLEELSHQINQAIAHSIAQLDRQMTQYVQEELQQHADDFFSNLSHYLRCYQESLKQVQQARQQSLEAERKLVGTLKSLVPETIDKIKKTETYLERTDVLLNAS